jgi:peptidoglycan/LPS O-acetylase OafA/YrhL
MTKGRSSGFDYLRLSLAVAVALDHIPYIATGLTPSQAALKLGLPAPFDTYLAHAVGAVTSNLLPMFFALSGFLVAGSLERCQTLAAFIGLRMIRIFPALMVEVILSALLIGPIVTRVSISHYLSSPLLLTYFLNLTGEVHYILPGVFIDSPDRSVNGQLWSIPYELLCYASLVAMVLIGGRKNRVIVLVLTTLSIVIFVMRYTWRHGFDVGLYVPSGLTLIWCFLAGVNFYQYRDRIRHGDALGAVSLTGALLTTQVGGALSLLAPIFVAYLTAYIGLMNPNRIFVLDGADYSYGIYLYHWVIQQSVMQFIVRRWTVGLLFGLPLTFLVAALSWHAIESRVVGLRRPLLAADKERRGLALDLCWITAVALLGNAILLAIFPLK